MLENSSVGRESMTLLSSAPQKGHFILGFLSLKEIFYIIHHFCGTVNYVEKFNEKNADFFTKSAFLTEIL